MTNADLKAQLMADPNAAINYIVNNNPDAVVDRLRGYGFNVAKWEDIGAALNEMLERGEKQKFIDVLNVPFITENADPSDVLAVKDAAIALNAQAGTNVAKSMDVAALFGGLATGTLFYLGQTGQQVQVKPADGSQPPKPPAKDKTWLYVGIGVAVVVAIVVSIIILKKKNG